MTAGNVYLQQIFAEFTIMRSLQKKSNISIVNKQDVLKKDAQGRFLFALNNHYENQPILLTEYGGIAFKSDHADEWGYFGAVKDENEFFLRFEQELSAFWKNPYFCGYCYTQLTDVQQEVNGLMTSDRESKVNVDLVRKINESCHRIR